MVRRLVERVVAFEEGELAPAVLSAVYFFCVLFGYFMLRPLRDAMGLAGGVDSLRRLFLVTLAVMIVANLVFAAVASRVPRRVFVPLVYGFGVACLVGFLLAFLVLGEHRSETVGKVFYVWLSVFNLMATTVFWGFMADIFRKDQAARLFGFIAVGGTAGAICGSAWTGMLADVLGTVGLFAGASVLFVAAGGIAIALDRVAQGRDMGSAEHALAHGAPLGGTSWQGVVDVILSPYLLGIAAYVLLFTVGSTLLYFEKMRIVAAFAEETEARARVLAWIEFGGQTLTVVLQLLLTGRLMRRFGAGALLAIVPIVTILGFVALAFWPIVLVVGAFDATRRAANFALSKPAREALFTIVPRAEKYKAKGLIDTFVYRGGDTVGTLADAGLAAIGLVAAWLVVPLGAASLGLGLWLGRRERDIALDATPMPDPIPEPTPGAGSLASPASPQI
ncbi:MAG: NTP/NDP exchange transporter [Phycisphaerales bacterium JB064]